MPGCWPSNSKFLESSLIYCSFQTMSRGPLGALRQTPLSCGVTVPWTFPSVTTLLRSLPALFLCTSTNCFWLLASNNRFLLLFTSNISNNKQLLYFLSNRYLYNTPVQTLSLPLDEITWSSMENYCKGLGACSGLLTSCFCKALKSVASQTKWRLGLMGSWIFFLQKLIEITWR